MAIYNGTYKDDLLIGSKGSDTLYGKAGGDAIIGNEGNDALWGEDGDDTLDGGNLLAFLMESGNDSLYGGNGNDTLTALWSDGRNVLYGGNGNDSLYGGFGHDLLYGGLGNDSITGSDGNDTITGGGGIDALEGGEGKDTFVLVDKSSDTIEDFYPIDDKIQLENGVMKSLTKLGLLYPSFFRVGDKAADSNDFIVYSPSTGQLFYDSDGNGHNKQVEIAKIGAGLQVTFNDFFVI